jgi:hypothetical protein
MEDSDKMQYYLHQYVFEWTPFITLIANSQKSLPVVPSNLTGLLKLQKLFTRKIITVTLSRSSPFRFLGPPCPGVRG